MGHGGASFLKIEASMVLRVLNPISFEQDFKCICRENIISMGKNCLENWFVFVKN